MMKLSVMKFKRVSHVALVAITAGVVSISPSFVYAQTDESAAPAIEVETSAEINNQSPADIAPPPSDQDLNEAFDELDKQLQDLQDVIEEANSELGAEGLPVIDPDNEPDIFYDSVPVRRGVQPTAPEKVDPIAKPAGKVVHVSKGFDSDSDQALLATAKRALNLGRYDSALEFYNQLYKKNPRDTRVLMGRAVSQQNLGLVQNAIKTYEELLNVQPGNLSAEISMLGLVKTRFPAQALQRMLELYQRNPNDAGLNAQIGMTYAQIGNARDAMRYLGMAVSLEPNNSSYFYNLAVVSDRAGDYKNAVKFYEESLSKDITYGGSKLPRDVIYERLSIIRQRS